MFRLKIILAYQKHSSHPLLGGSLHACTGRALEWHSRGQRFDPAYLHQNAKIRTCLLLAMGSDFSYICMNWNRPRWGPDGGGIVEIPPLFHMSSCPPERTDRASRTAAAARKFWKTLKFRAAGTISWCVSNGKHASGNPPALRRKTRAYMG